MDIVEIIPSLEIGGVSSLLINLTRYFAANNTVTVVVLFSNNDTKSHRQVLNELVKNGITIVELRCHKRNFILAGLKLRAHFQKNHYHIVHFHLRYSALALSIATIFRKPCNTRIVETYHSNYSFYKWISRISNRYTDHYVAVSGSAFREMIITLKLPDRKCSVIANGINQKEIQNYRCFKTNNDSSTIRLIAFGRMSTEKGFHLIFQAFKSIPKAICKHFSLSLIGEGPQLKYLEDLATESPVQVRFFPFLEKKELYKHILESDLVVMPSLFEGLSFSFLEALSLGKAMIFSNIPSFLDALNVETLGENEFMRECPFGFLIDQTSQKGLKDCLQYVIEQNIDKNKFTSNCLQKAKDFDISHTANQYLNLFKSLMK